jgi:hypothetical protein
MIVLAKRSLKASVTDVIGGQNGFAMTGQQRMQHAEAERCPDQRRQTCNPCHTHRIERFERAGIEPALKFEDRSHDHKHCPPDAAFSRRRLKSSAVTHSSGIVAGPRLSVIVSFIDY